MIDLKKQIRTPEYEEEKKKKKRSAKISISIPERLVDFIDAQCARFNCGRSSYIQMLLDAEQTTPRDEFVKKARHSA